MVSTRFVGREREMKRLRDLQQKNSASLIVVRGRRRIGKSRLLEEFGKEMTSKFFSGQPPDRSTTAQSQRDSFARQLKRAGLPEVKPDNWGDLFWTLAKSVDQGPVLVVLDEISWMGGKDPEFLGELKTAWDMYFSKNPKLILVLCGSISSWIEKNILSSTGFVGRIVIDLVLEELPIDVCNAFWHPKENRITAYEKFKLLSVTGGVPLYLEQVRPDLTAEENIQTLCFTQGGLLVREFDEIFSDLFSRSKASHKEIAAVLAEGPRDLAGILKVLGRSQGGAYSKQLDELVKAGFVKRDFTWSIDTGKLSKLSRFRLSDNYLRFYLKYIAPNRGKIDKGVFEHTGMTNLVSWDAILALQFENLVANNYKILWKSLQIRSEDIVVEGPFFQKSTKEQKGCQIDYMIQTRFNTLYVCEVKFSRSKVSQKVISEMKAKIVALGGKKKFSIRPVLIHVNGVDKHVEGSGFFDQIIDFSQMIGHSRKQIDMRALEDAYKQSINRGENKTLGEVADELGVDVDFIK